MFVIDGELVFCYCFFWKILYRVENYLLLWLVEVYNVMIFIYFFYWNGVWGKGDNFLDYLIYVRFDLKLNFLILKMKKKKNNIRIVIYEIEVIII